MGQHQFQPTDIPYFSYDRPWTNEMIRARLATPGSRQWLETAGWIMREAAFEDVWRFLDTADVNRFLHDLAPYLGKKREFWRYIIGAWRELGKLESLDAA